jgi:hypothetical protein
LFLLAGISYATDDMDHWFYSVLVVILLHKHARKHFHFFSHARTHRWNPLIVLLFLLAGISYATDDMAATVIIGVTVSLSVVVGISQEVRIAILFVAIHHWCLSLVSFVLFVFRCVVDTTQRTQKKSTICI